MRKLLLLSLLTLALNSLWAQGEYIDISLQARADYMQEHIKDLGRNGAFQGKYLNLCLDGSITKDLKFSLRHRLNKANFDSFDATDWIHLTYNTRRWSFSAGKQVVWIGGYEYDRAPINLYFCSEYWNNIACYQFGVSASYALGEGADKLIFQVCQSPFRTYSEEDMYAYNLMWAGSHGALSTTYSVNMIEYQPGEFINYIALGHRLKLGDWALELDFMNRATKGHQFLFKDCSVMSELSWSPSEKWNIFGKFTYDVNDTDSVGDYCVMAGTDLKRVGGGVEFYPIKGSRAVRLHANACYTYGKNGNEFGVLIPKQTIADAGLTWFIDIWHR